MDDAALLIMARFPRPGQVKTRLAAELGSDPACEIYRLCAERLFGESARLLDRMRVFLFYDNPADSGAVRRWADARFLCRPQIGDDLGARLAHAMRQAFREGARKAVVVGSDIPDLDATLIAQAVALLESYPVVLGPDHGGGYYLMGTKMLYEDLFLGRVAWGTNRVLGKTLRIMAQLGLQPAFLPPLIDLDTAGDVRQWLATRPPSEEGQLEQYLRAHLDIR